VAEVACMKLLVARHFATHPTEKLLPLIRAVQEDIKFLTLFVFKFANVLPHHYTIHVANGSLGRRAQQFS